MYLATPLTLEANLVSSTLEFFMRVDGQELDWAVGALVTEAALS